MKLLYGFSFLSLLFFIGVFVEVQAQQDICFEHLSSKEGLSQNSVNYIFQDKSGFIWLGTRDGLNRYDAYTFKIYQNDPIDSTSLSHNHVLFIYEDIDKRLWMCTRGGGLNMFNAQTEKFTTFKSNINDSTSLSDNHVSSMCQDNSGAYWIGTNNGLNRFDPQTGKFIRYLHNAGQANSLINNEVLSLYHDQEGVLWIGTKGGLDRFDLDTNQFTHFSQANDTTSPVKEFAVSSIYKDKAGTLWIGTLGGGLKKLDAKKRKFISFFNEEANHNTINDNSVTSILEDSFGVLWVGTRQKGLTKFNRQTGVFTSLLHNDRQDCSINDNFVLSIFEDRAKVLWIGTFNNGLNLYDRTKIKFAYHKTDPSKLNSLKGKNVHCLYEDHRADLWIASNKGVEKLEVKTGKFTSYNYDPAFLVSTEDNPTYSICEDRNGVIWASVHGSGLAKLNHQTGFFTWYKHNPQDEHSLSSNLVSAIYKDRKGDLWIGTANGLNKFDPQTNSFIRYFPSKKRFDSKGKYAISQLYEDKEGVFWIGTLSDGLASLNRDEGTFTHYPYLSDQSTNGNTTNIISILESKTGTLWISFAGNILHKFDRKRAKFTPITSQDGLPTNVVWAILEDNHGNLWLSTRRDGVLKYNPYKKSHRRYGVANGLLSNEFTGANLKNTRGEIFFGSNNGFIFFHPDSLQDNKIPPQIAITGFRIFDKIRKGFNPNKIELQYGENFFAFDFAALSYSMPEKNQYAYQLIGIDKDWIYSGERRYASYTNVEAGTYKLRIKASNSDGYWNEKGVEVKVIIYPPWWRTRLAYSLYGLVILGVLWISRLSIIKAERQKADQRLRLLHAEQTHQIDQLKSRFFTNVSHELRTPLTLIFAPLEKLLTEQLNTRQVQSYSRLIDKHARQLLQLINQLMDFSKLESGSLKLILTPGDVNSQIKSLTLSFASLAENKGVHLIFGSDYQFIDAHYDSNILEKVIHNLLSNAFKFTPAGGKVAVAVTLSEGLQELTNKTPFHINQWLEVCVKDTGIGIPAEEQERIFDRFYQVDGSQVREVEGTGIGLALAKELVELHGGKIDVKSVVGQGSDFRVYLPLSECKAQIKQGVDQQKIIPDPLIEVDQENKDGKTPISYALTPTDHIEPNESYPVLLIVEDNTEVREFMRDSFKDDFQVMEACNGLEGLERSRQHIPDLIITDRMMPKMDGIELCRQLKTNAVTSHIPIIMLTAKAAQESKIEGLEIGADDYVAKPFSLKELKARSKNLIEQRKKLRERFTKEVKLQPKDIAITSTDELFINKAIAIVEKHMSDENFTVEIMVEEIAMSRVQLHRKLKALTGQSTSEFIRTIRLKRAASLLEQGYGSISEVMYAVGFNSVSYFASNFKQRYGVNPSQYPTQPVQ